jgi:hypothetical protein
MPVFLFPTVATGMIWLAAVSGSANHSRTPDGRCMPVKKPNKAEQAWKAAQAALEAARQLPAGVERCEALKKAGKLRFDADVERTLEISPGKSGAYSND